MNGPSALLILSTSLGASACGAGSEVLKATGGLEAFPTYCTGTLSKKTSVSLATEAGAWFGQGEVVAAGAPVLVSVSFGRWGAYGLLADGTPFMVESDFTKGLTLDADFSAGCASTGRASEQPSSVLLRDVDFYGAADLTGTPCALKRGTSLSSFSFAAPEQQGGAAKVASAEVRASCGFDQAYSKMISFAPLLTQ